MFAIATFIHRTIIALLPIAHQPVAEAVDLWRAIGSANRNAAKGVLQRLEQFLAQPCPRRDGKVRVVGDIR